MISKQASRYDLSKPWNINVRGSQILPLINDDAPIIRVEAGPGTGKTFGLVQRIMRILHPDGLAESGKKVAIVAFNRVIAKQLRADIEKALKSVPHDGSPVIQTVHGFCLMFVGEDIRILLPHEREAMLYDVLHESTTLQMAFKRHKDVEQALHDHEASIREHPILWQAVVQWLNRHRARLIGDLPGLMLDRVRGGNFIEAMFSHVIVDEFQDLSPAQQELFLRLRADNGQLVALGDPRQSIYAFLGNERKGLAKLSKHPVLKGVQIHDISLSECQRCPKEIVEAANKLMSHSEAMPMTPASNAPARIQVVKWKTPVSEAKGMAKLILNNIRASDSSHKHLVMVTRRKLGRRLREELIKLDPSINVELGFSESILDLWPVREAFLFFCLLADPDAPTWRAWLGYRTPSETQDHNAPERNADAYLKFLAGCQDMITSEAVQKLAQEERSTLRGQGGGALWDRAYRYIEVYQKRKWTRLTSRNLIVALFDPSLWVSGQDDNMTNVGLDFKLIKNNALQMLEESESRSIQDKQKGYLRQVARQLRYSIATREPLTVTSESTVKVTTLWGAKGLTADHAYVIGLCREAIPAERSPEYPGNYQDYIEEQRRLFYVTITRSRQTLILSYPLGIRPSEAKQLNLRVDMPDFYYCTLQICPFLRDIIDELPEPIDGEELLQSWVKKRIRSK